VIHRKPDSKPNGKAHGRPLAVLYTGRANDGSQVTFTVALGSGQVEAYHFDDVVGRRRSGDKCIFVGNGALGVWKGVPITRNQFSYTLGTALIFHGSFSGPRRIQGTVRFFSPAVGRTPACATGVIRWSARTSS
jgi:hypothetical protein